MAKFEKTDQIDHYLNQIDKKQDSSFRRKIFLFIGLLLLLGVSYVAYNQMSGKDSLAEGSTNINTNDIGSSGIVPIAINNNNLDEDLLSGGEEELDSALNPEVENLEDAIVEEDNAAALAAAKKRQEEANENPARPTTGVSERTYTAAELADLPSVQIIKKGEETADPINKNVAPSEKEKADKATAEAEETKKIAAEAADKEEADKIAKETAAATKKATDTAALAEAAAAKKSTAVTKDPSYPGGEARMRQFFAKKITYPNKAIDDKVEGSVDVRIRVDEKGRIVDSQVVKGIGAGCDKEVLKAINKMPKWSPAEKDGEPVAKYYLLSVAFKLPN
jgi:TonB family protein